MTYYARAAAILDRELSKSDAHDRAFRQYAEEAFARRGALAHYLTRIAKAAEVSRIADETSLWVRRIPHY
jgi:hypothetical protein